MDPSFSNLAPPPPPQVYLPFMLPPSATAPVGHNQIPNPPAAPVQVIPPNPNHPSYTEMIYAAITALKEQDGSSKRAIAKYIERAFSDLPSSHSSLLAHHLKRLKENGSLVMVKKSYKLPRSDFPISDNNHPAVTVGDESAPPPPPSTGPKKGRGRPPKPKSTTDSVPLGPVVSSQPMNYVVSEPVPVPVVNLNSIVPGHVVPAESPSPSPSPSMSPVTTPAPSVKRGRGRPPMNGGSILSKRGRGRPPLSGTKKSTARPKKPKSISSSNGLKRGRGRPPKEAAAAAPVQAPQLVAPAPAQPQVNAVSAPGTPLVPRSRGRPRKTAAVPLTAGAGAGVNLAAVSGKRRGRPRGGVNSPPKLQYKTVRSGRFVGRPKKYLTETTVSAGGERTVSADGERVADLRRKLEFFQSKVMQAVGALKPQFTSESNISAIAAIQDLEGLGAMDITAPFRDEPQPQEPVVVQNQPQEPAVVQNQPQHPAVVQNQPPPPQQPIPMQFFQSHQSYPPPPGY